MRIIFSFVCIVCITGVTASATERPIPSPERTECPDPVASIADCYTARHESGAYILAAMPKAWNGNLVVFAHGGPSLIPYTANYSKLDLAKFAVTIQLGYGWVASSYRREGYGITMSAEDTEDARRLFTQHLGKPKRTVIQGASYGALVAAKVLETQARSEQSPKLYDGGLFNSGLLAGPLLGYEFRVDLRVVYQYFCRNLPRDDEPQYPLWNGLHANSRVTLRDLQGTIDECTGATRPAGDRTAAQKENLANITKVIGIPENLLFRHMQSATLLFRGIVTNITGGRNPFSNANVRYKGSSDDERLNREVARFSAEPSAVVALRADGDPTGLLDVPVISIHAIKDPQVAVESQSVFRDRAEASGNGSRLVQVYTDDNRHNFHSDPELSAAFDMLMNWIDKSAKPTPQTISKTCEQASTTYQGPCRYRVDYQPEAYRTKFYPRNQ